MFAALNATTGEVIYDTKPRHTAKEVLAFFKWIDLHVPTELDIDVVLDNLSAHKAPPFADWLAHPRRARWHPTTPPPPAPGSTWSKAGFKQLTERRLRRGVFTSVSDLIDAIETWAEDWNHDPKPFIWHETAEEMIEKVRRGKAALSIVTNPRRTTRVY